MQDKSHEAGGSRQKRKVAIPKLDRRPPLPPKLAERNRDDRVARACKICRRRKVKCSGELPRCAYCHVNDLNCEYEQARRDRLKEATELNHTLASLLRDLSNRVDGNDKRKIIDALDNAEDDLISQSHDTVPSVITFRTRPQKESNEDDQEMARHGEAFVTGSAGSNQGLDHLDEDLMRTRESRETGYVGQNSEVQWLRSVQRQTEHSGVEPHGQPYGPSGSGQQAVEERSDALRIRRANSKDEGKQGPTKHITDSTFYLDSHDIDVDILVDPNEFPDPEHAERLINCYTKTVHPSFPLVPASFVRDARKYIESHRNRAAFQVPNWWRAQINLLFAIGAKYSHLIGAEWEGDERDHLVYMTRGVHLLGLKNTVMIISGPDLHLVQATGALSFYFLAIGHVSRAWVMIGVSIRLALALGLHLRNEDPTAAESKKEMLARTWWCLHSIECLVSTITGRPPVIPLEDCTVALPHSLPGEHPKFGKPSRPTSRRRTDSSSTQTPVSRRSSEPDRRIPSPERYLISHINHTLISQKALMNLYSPRTAAQSWEFIQTQITELLTELEEWAKVTLPENVKAPHTSSEPEFKREQFLLRADYWSTKMLITRPCLCRIERRIKNESNPSAKFNARTAAACVEAALEMTKLFPDQPDLDFIYMNGPWWAIIHIMMQAMAVLLLEMSYNNKDMGSDDPGMTVSIKKLIRWLRAMQHNDPVALQAFQVVKKILQAVAPKLQAQVSDLLAVFGEAIPQAPPRRSQQQSGYWQQADVYRDTAETSTHFNPVPFRRQSFDPLTEYLPDAYPCAPALQNQMPMPFGNPFFTNFDQGAPVVNMQDLWSNPGTMNVLGEFPPNLDSSPNPQGNPENSDMDYSPQPLQYHLQGPPQ